MRWLLLLVGTLALPSGCASSDPVDDQEDDPVAGAGSEGGSSGGGAGGTSSGTSGQAGSDQAGASGEGGAGASSEGGRAGEGGDAGTAGAAGDAGTAGSAGDAGAGGESGSAGSAGASGAGAGGAGGAGTGGSAGVGGTAGASGTAGSGGAGGEGGGGVCATAVAVTVGPEQPLTLGGTTASSKNVFGAYCDKVGASGKDRVFAVTPTSDGIVDVTLTATDAVYDPVLSVTTGQCTVFVTNQDGSCANYGGPGAAEALTFAAKAGEPFWVYVDGVKSQDGAFTLSVEYQTGAAGSAGSSGASGQGGAGTSAAGGQAGTGGAGTAGAGASGAGGAGQGGAAGSGGAGTAGAGGAVGQTCEAPIKVAVGAGAPAEVNGTTAGAKNLFFGFCNIKYDGPDQVIEVTALSAGKLVATVEPLASDYDLALYGQKDECSTVLLASDTNNGNGDCSELLGPGVSESLDPLTMNVGGRVYLVVDSNTKNGVKGGPYRLTLTLQ